MLAIFDLDETLIKIDSELYWARYLQKINKPIYNNDLLTRLKQFELSCNSEDEYYRFTLGIIEGLKINDIQQDLDIFIENMIKPAVYKNALEEIKNHKQQNHKVLLFDVDDAIGTEILFENNRFTKKLVDYSAYREGKIKRLLKWKNENKINYEYEDMYFYSDSINDVFLLEKVKYPVATNPSDELKKKPKKITGKLSIIRWLDSQF